MDLALFDFDGTITEADTFLAFIRRATHPVRLRLGTLALAPMAVAYRTGIVKAPVMRSAVTRVAFCGVRAESLQLEGERFAQDYLAGCVRPESRERLSWHQRRGDRIVVVSASLDLSLAPWCRAEGLELICTEVERVGERYTGRYVGGDCSGKEKRRRVLERYSLTEYEQVYAYGDSPEDLAMLSVAHNKFYGGRPMS